MFKKMLLSVAVLTLLLAAETALAQQKQGNPKQKQNMAVTKQQQSPKAQFGKWFGQLKKAYRQNDNEKIGTLIQEMDKKRNQLNKSAMAKKSVKAVKRPGLYRAPCVISSSVS